nr:oxysterol-binding protein homolog 1-like [Ipomoea batatas]
MVANSQDSTHLEQSEQSVHSPTQYVESLEPLSNAPIIETFKPKLQTGSILDTAGFLTFINDKELGKKVLKCLEDGGLLKYATFDYKQHHLDDATEFYINSKISNTKDAFLSTINGAKVTIVHAVLRRIGWFAAFCCMVLVPNGGGNAVAAVRHPLPSTRGEPTLPLLQPTPGASPPRPPTADDRCSDSPTEMPPFAALLLLLDAGKTKEVDVILVCGEWKRG